MSANSYEVYEMPQNKHLHLAYCDDYDTACKLALALALCDSESAGYYVTEVGTAGMWCPGGGGYTYFARNYDGTVRRYELS